MSAKKAKELRKKLGMTKENLKNSDTKIINPVKKVVYFKNSLGDLVPRQAERGQIINTNMNFYRKQKKLRNKGK